MINKEEKILLLQLILEDIRGNWADFLEERFNKAIEICNELIGELKDVEILKEKIENIDYEDSWFDGRCFRTDYPKGYQGMDSLHNLEKTFNDKSEDFKKCCEVLTYPENRFTDKE